MSRRTLTVGLLIVIGILCGSYLALCRYELPIPQQWQQIQFGQHRDDVLARMPELKTESLLDMKQFDQTIRSFYSPVFGRVTQHLIVDYDNWRPEVACVIQIRVQTYTERFRLLRNQRFVARSSHGS